MLEDVILYQLKLIVPLCMIQSNSEYLNRFQQQMLRSDSMPWGKMGPQFKKIGRSYEVYWNTLDNFSYWNGPKTIKAMMMEG